MKKVAIALVLLLTSCHDTEPDAYRDMTIYSIKKSVSGCVYTVQSPLPGANMYSVFRFEDDCGKFNIGDRVKITK